MSESTAVRTTGWRNTQAKLANATRNRRPETEVADLRRRFKYEKLADHVDEVINSAPPLSDEQRATIADLLVGGGRR